MSFSATGAHRPLQSKPKQNPFLRRSSSSAFTNHPRRKPGTGEPSLKRTRTEGSDDAGDRLDNRGIVTSLPPKQVPQDVVSLMHHARALMFDAIPERSAGMNSVRIAEVLQFRRRLPPVVSKAHLHALSASNTATEREVARLVQAGTVRKVNVLGRGRGGAAIGEGLVLVEDWVRLVQNDSSLEQDLQTKYIDLLRNQTSSSTVPATAFTNAEIPLLMAAGLLTSTSALASSSDTLSRPGAFSLGTPTVATAGSAAATGTLAAVGGNGAVHARGGGGGGLPASARIQPRDLGSLTFSLPSTGIYLRLLTEARAHLGQLLSRSSPKYRESSRDMLRERWDGGIPADDAATRAKRARGEWSGVLPGKTKKWKTFYGMKFDWILEECLGSGTVECFNTGSVGLGIRAT